MVRLLILKVIISFEMLVYKLMLEIGEFVEEDIGVSGMDDRG